MSDDLKAKAEEIKTKVEEQLEGRKDLIRALFLCLLAVIFVRSFVVEPFKIPSSSMVPTLKIGDRIFVSKFNYGLSIPFTKFEFVRFGAPKRGQVIVFLSPRDESLHYIKRVVGVPGDTIEFDGKEIKINGEIVPKEQVTDSATIDKVMGSVEASGEIYRETLGSNHYVRYSKGAMGEFSRGKQVETIPDDKFFVVGDNRDDSYDSRSWGYVPRENIKGRALLVWLSLDADGGWNSMEKIRWDRCGTIIP